MADVQLNTLASVIAQGTSGFTQTGSGAVARTIQAKLREPMTALDFGAVANGTTNDTSALQAAINAAQTAGVPLVLTPGIYAIRTPISFPAGSCILGWGATIKVDAANWSGSWAAQINDAAGVRLYGFTIDGQDDNALLYGIDITGDCANCVLDSLRVHSLTYNGSTVAAVHVNGAAHRLVITRCRFDDIDGNAGIARAIWVRNVGGESYATGIQVIGNVFHNMPDIADTDALDLTGGSGDDDEHRGHVVANNYFEDIGKRCVKAYTAGVKIIGNYDRRALATAGNAFIAIYSQDVEVIGNTSIMLNGGYNHCIDFHPSGGVFSGHRAKIKGNRFYRDTVTVTEAIRLYGYNDIEVEGNHFLGAGNWRWIVRIYGSAHGLHFINNICDETVLASLSRSTTGFAANNAKIIGNTIRSADVPITWPASSNNVICIGNHTSPAIDTGLTSNVTGLVNANNTTIV